MAFSGMRFLVVLAVALAAVQAPAAASAESPTKLERRTTLEAEIMREVNSIRADRGLHPLRAAPNLRSAARAHSRAMLGHGFFGHDSMDGTAFSDRIKRYYTDRGWEMWSVGEVLLSNEGQIDAEAIVIAWLDSPPHRELILSPAWHDAGIGVMYTALAPATYGGGEAVVVTADFGLRDGKAGNS